MSKVVLNIVLLFMVCTSKANVIIDQDYEGFIGKHCSYWIDQSGDKSIEEVKTAYVKNEFIRIEQDVFENVSAVPVYWFHFDIQSNLQEELWLNINNSNLLSVDLYQLNKANEVFKSYHTGCLEDRVTRPFDTETFWFPLLKGGDNSTATILIRLKAGINMEAPFEVGTFKALLIMKEKSDFLAILFMGAMLIMFCYNLFVYIYTKDRIYLIYVAYIIAMTFSTTFLNNYPVLSEIIGLKLAYVYTASWLWIVFVTMGFFGIFYLNMRVKYPFLFNVIRIELLLLIGFGGLNFFIESSALAVYYEFAVLLYYFTSIYTALYVLNKERNSKTLLYAIGWILVIIGGLIYLLVINTIIPYTYLTRNAMYFGVMSEVLIFSIALARRLYELKAYQEILNLELEHTNKSLKQNNEALDSFNYHVSHDLKTVLNNSNALARMAKKYNKKGDNLKVDEIVSKLLIVTENGSETVQSFLTLGKIDSLFRNEQATELNVKDEINRILSDHEIELDLNHLSTAILAVKMHKKAFESIFLNLFTNTVKYAIDHPAAELHIYTEGEELIFRYKDFGQGIDLKSFGHLLFKPFERGGADESTEGTGVGLYIVKRIVEMYKGDINLQSTVGNGVELTLKFPVEMIS